MSDDDEELTRARHLHAVPPPSGPYDWRTDRTHAAMVVLTIAGEQSSFGAREDARGNWHMVPRFEPGTFESQLVQTMFRADSMNLALLGIGFPGMAEAVRIYKDEPAGVLILRERAGWTEGMPRDDGSTT